MIETEETPIISEQPEPIETHWNKYTTFSELKTKQLKCIYLLSCGNIAYYCDESYANEECFCFGTDVCAWYSGCYCCVCSSVCGFPIFLWVHLVRNLAYIDYSDFFEYNEYVNIDTLEVEN